MEKAERTRRKEILKNLKDQKRQRALAALPASVAALKGLFDWLDANLGECDNTLRLSLEYIRQNNLDRDRVVEWLEENGGYCDCEVLANVEESPAFGE